MGQQQTKAESYSQATNVLTNDQLLIIKKQFRHLASRTDDEGTIDKDTFLKFLPLPGMLGERLFRVCDRDRDNAIDFQEFLSAIALLVHGTEEDRYRLLFDMYNLGGDDGITRQELVTMFNSIRGEPVPDSEPPEAIDRMDKAELEELEKKTLEELADIDQQIASSLAEPDAVYSLLEQKAAKELLLSRIGRDALEAYRVSHVTLQDTVKKLAEEAIRTCGRLRSGKLNFDQFCVWAKANPLALDSIFKSEAILELTHRLGQAPTLRSLERAQIIEEGTMFGYLVRRQQNRKGTDRRFYFLQDHFLYEYKNEKAALSYTPAPREAIFLRGCHILSDLHPEDTPLSSPLPGDLTSGVPIPSGRVSVRDRDRTRSRDRRLARSRSRERLESDFGVSASSTANTAYAEGLNDSELVASVPAHARVRRSSVSALAPESVDDDTYLADGADTGKSLPASPGGPSGPEQGTGQPTPLEARSTSAGNSAFAAAGATTPAGAAAAASSSSSSSSTAPTPPLPGASVPTSGRPPLFGGSPTLKRAQSAVAEGVLFSTAATPVSAGGPGLGPRRQSSGGDTEVTLTAASASSPPQATTPAGSATLARNTSSGTENRMPMPPPMSRMASSTLSDDVEYETLGGDGTDGAGGGASGGGSGASDTRLKIEIVYGIHNETHIILYAEAQSTYEKWVHALEAAAETRHIEDFYEIDYAEELGRGFFADVYVCRPASQDGRADSDQRFACKIIYKTDMNELQTEMFRNEIACLRLVRHPNIVRMLAMFETPEKVYLVMELLEGGSVLSRIERDKRVAKEQAANIVKQVLEGIDYLHECGIIHRDLKPGNLVFTSDRDDAVVKIVDFGLSTFATEADNLSTPVGTLKYLSPELVLKKGYNREVDLWCIGILAYILITASFPFDGRTQQDLLQNIVNARFNTAIPAWQEVDAAARDFIKRLLQVDPQKRMTTKEALEHPWITGALFTGPPSAASVASPMMMPVVTTGGTASGAGSAVATPAGAFSTQASNDLIDALPPLPPAMMSPKAAHTTARSMLSPPDSPPEAGVAPASPTS